MAAPFMPSVAARFITNRVRLPTAAPQTCFTMRKLSSQQMKSLKGGSDKPVDGCPTDVTCCYNQVLPGGLIVAVLSSCGIDANGRCMCGPDLCVA